MQTIKEDTRRILLKTAREAFLRKGFRGVSMREISKVSGVGLSNIYNYFPCKDDLLAVILNPIMEMMNAMLDNHNRKETLSLDIFTSEEYHRKTLQELLGMTTRYRMEFRLLFLDTKGTRLENFWQRWIDKSTAIGQEYMELMETLYPNLHTHISPFFIRFASSWWIGMIREVVMHEKLSQVEIEQFISEYVHFTTGGWQKVMNVEQSRNKQASHGKLLDETKISRHEYIITRNEDKHTKAPGATL